MSLEIGLVLYSLYTVNPILVS